MNLWSKLRSLFSRSRLEREMAAEMQAHLDGLTERNIADSGKLDLGASLDANYNPLVRRLAAFPIPTIAAVNGPAAGAGAGVELVGAPVVVVVLALTRLIAAARSS